MKRWKIKLLKIDFFPFNWKFIISHAKDIKTNNWKSKSKLFSTKKLKNK